MVRLPFAAPDDFQPSRVGLAVLPSAAEWFVLRDRELLVSSTDGFSLPNDDLALPFTATQNIGYLRGVPVIAAAVAPNTPPPVGWVWKNLRTLFDLLDDSRLSVAGRAAQLLDWELCHAFCGRCGATTLITRSLGRVCPHCQLTAFTRIEPSVIVAVRKPTRQILLARSPRFPPGVQSVLAGFLEPGETLEQAAEREVFEETGIRIKNLRYAASQPWPFPRSLMVGFLAEYESGEINIDPVEIETADWFTFDALPLLPPHLSIARWLIEQTIAEENA